MRLLMALTTMAYGLACLTACEDDPGDDPPTEVDASMGASDADTEHSDAGVPPDAALTLDAANGETDAAAVGAGDSGVDSGADAAVSGLTVLDLDDVVANPDDYEWFDFRPNVKKLILAGAAETEHIALLWYTVEDGAVGLHYHSMTESVYVIDGSQTDAQGVYPTGTVYFNPPGSGHEITNSSGFFILAYASPPDFENTDLIGEYTPVRIDTEDPELTDDLAFEEQTTGVSTYAIPIDDMGGMTAEFIATTSSEVQIYVGNYLLVLDGDCEIDGETYGKEMLVVTNTVVPQPYAIAAAGDATCLAMGVSF